MTLRAMDQPSAGEVASIWSCLGKGFPENRLGGTAGQAGGQPAKGER
jgi:hypothetical protein